MSPTSWIILGAAAVGFVLLPIAISYIVEALRVEPAEPRHLGWAPDLPIRHADANGVRIRYVKAGQGPPVVLLHTLRTQLDMFHKVIPELARDFTVYALDYPGHGFSGIPKVEYTPDYFTDSVAAFLDALDVQAATLAGESIGGSIALRLAARRNPRVRRVVVVNPYDYDGGRGLRRSSWIANVIFGLNDVPVLGSTFERLRLYPLFRKVLEGGVARKEAIPEFLARHMYEVGNRRGHYHALMSLVTHWAGWERARAEYSRIQVPVVLVYGDGDWSRPDEREANRSAIPAARFRIVEGAGHFLSLDAPRSFVQAVVESVGSEGAGARTP